MKTYDFYDKYGGLCDDGSDISETSAKNLILQGFLRLINKYWSKISKDNGLEIQIILKSDDSDHLKMLRFAIYEHEKFFQNFGKKFIEEIKKDA